MGASKSFVFASLWLVGACASSPPSATPVVSSSGSPSDAPSKPLSIPRDIVAGPTVPGATGGTCENGKLEQALSSKAIQSRQCYESLLRKQPDAQGRMVVGLKLSKRGKVESARLVSDDLGDAQLASCVLKRFRGASYPAPKSGCAEVHVPLRYEPRRSAKSW
jgi:hypothetical protein